MRIEIPEPCLLVLIGPAGAGKSTFARARFRPTEVLSSDAFRAMVADDEGDLSATAAAFEVLHLVATLRLKRLRTAVVDAVSARPEDRRPLVALAAARDCAAVALVLDLPEELCAARDRERAGRTVGARVIAEQRAAILRSLPGLRDEGFAAVHVLTTPEEVDAVELRRVPVPVNRRRVRGPFDVVGDVHGRLDALVTLLDRLGYAVERGADGAPVSAAHPARRRVVFAGDLAAGTGGSADRAVVRLAMGMVSAGAGLAVAGDRDEAAAACLPEAEAAFLRGLPSHLVLDGGALVVAHAGLRSDLQGRDSARVRRLCVEGEREWAASYRGRALVVHGHEPVPEPRWRGRTVDVHVSGSLTALRHPEREVVSVLDGTGG